MGSVLNADSLRIFLEKACIVTLGKPQEPQDDDDDLFSFGMRCPNRSASSTTMFCEVAAEMLYNYPPSLVS
jgi:hypothetical protein